MAFETPTLENELVRLEPLRLVHASSLLDLVDPELWSGMTRSLPKNLADMLDYLRSLTDDPSRASFVVIDKSTGDVVGSTCLYDFVPSQERVEIGSTFYGRSVWGGYVNPSCKLLLFEHAFDHLKVFRVALRCDARNQRSAAAIERLGAKYEGKLRGHRLAADGSRGDTLYFSVILPEWPSVREGLEARLIG